MQKNLIRILPIILYSIIIYYLSSLPAEKLPEESFLNFYTLAHLCEYSIYGFILAWGMPYLKQGFLILLGSGFGLFDEIHQSFVPTRTACLGDLIVDIIGVTAGIFLFLYLRRRLYVKAQGSRRVPTIS